MLDTHGPVGTSERLILFDSLAIMLAIVLPVIVAIVAFAWWFRASNVKATYRPTWAFSGSLELMVWAIPILVITFLGGIAWSGSHALDPYRPLDSKRKALEVEVVSLDWKWLFIYPDERIASVNQLVIAADTPVHFRITSATVWNTLFVPQLGSMIYSMPGMTTQLYLQADQPGTFRGESGMFSGDKFADMHFEVRSLDRGDYAQWVGHAKASANVLDRTMYAQLAQREDIAPLTIYGSVDPELFEAIVDGTAPASKGAADVSNTP